jgi:phospholipid transport system substrate-binding protein
MEKLAMLNFMLIVPVAAALAAPAVTPTVTLKSKNGEVDKLLRLKTEPKTAADSKRKDEIKVLASSLFDYGELVKQAMAAHWDKINPKQREELVSTMKGLIERKYVKDLKGNLDYQVQYRDEKITGDQASVMSIVKVKRKGKSSDVEVEYKLRNVGDKWLVWDVINDEISQVRNYKSQFNRIITDSGFDELLRKMKSKLNEKDADD